VNKFGNADANKNLAWLVDVKQHPVIPHTDTYGDTDFRLQFDKLPAKALS
jgi:hypothetical protein